MSYHTELCPDTLSVNSPGDSIRTPDSVSVQILTAQMPPEEETVLPSRREKCFNCCKKFTAFLCSTIGLTSMLIGYTIFGGFIFENLESQAEKDQKVMVRESRASHVQELWNATMMMNVLYPENWTRTAEDIFFRYTAVVFEATKKKGWDGQDQTGDVQWTFAGSMLYAITVITTIGYGHIAPKTLWGRVVTIFYAVIGIPLCLLTITNLGGFMATAFRFIYHNICCGICCICCQAREKALVKKASRKYKDTENGDPGVNEALTGLNSPDSIDTKGSTSPRAMSRSLRDGSRSPRSPSVKKKISTTVTWRSGLRRALRTEDNKSVSVPIYVSLLLISGYILSGAVLFTLWENWGYLEGTYFCFITLTTIGFGDFVPGSDQNSWNNQKKLVICALYLIVGLSLIAMCFDLMQEEIRNKVRALGTKLGLVDKEKKDGEASNLDNAPKATQTTSPATSKPPKSSSSSSVKNFTLSKPHKSKSKTSLNANNVDTLQEKSLSRKEKRELKAREKKQKEEDKAREKREKEEQKENEKRDKEEQRQREIRKKKKVPTATLR